MPKRRRTKSRSALPVRTRSLTGRFPRHTWQTTGFGIGSAYQDFNDVLPPGQFQYHGSIAIFALKTLLNLHVSDLPDERIVINES